MKERRKIKFNYEGRFFIVGLIFGFLFFSFWDFYFNHNVTNNVKEELIIEKLKVDSNKMLLDYVGGIWVSSANDLTLQIDIDEKKQFLVVESSIGKSNIFKIIGITKVNGILGILRMEICSEKHNCEDNEFHIPIQLNKVFGVDKSITVSYDSRLAYCAEPDDSCVRGFKRHNN